MVKIIKRLAYLVSVFSILGCSVPERYIQPEDLMVILHECEIVNLKEAEISHVGKLKDLGSVAQYLESQGFTEQDSAERDFIYQQIQGCYDLESLGIVSSTDFDETHKFESDFWDAWIMLDIESNIVVTFQVHN